MRVFDLDLAHLSGQTINFYLTYRLLIRNYVIAYQISFVPLRLCERLSHIGYQDVLQVIAFKSLSPWCLVSIHFMKTKS